MLDNETGPASPSFSTEQVRGQVTELVAPYGVQDPSELRTYRPSLGALLVQSGILSEVQVQDALAEGMRSGERLGEVAVRKGWLSEERLAELIAEQWQLRYVEAHSLSVDPDGMQLVGTDIARELGVAPIGLDERGVVLAVADPSQATFTAVRERIGEASYVVVVRSALEQLLEGLGDVEQSVEAPAFAESEAVEPAAPENEPFVESGYEPESSVEVPEDSEALSDELVETHARVILDGVRASVPANRIGAALESIDGATSELRLVRDEVEALATALKRSEETLAEREADLEAEKAAEARDRETIRRLEEDLGQRTDLFNALGEQVANLSQTLQASGLK